MAEETARLNGMKRVLSSLVQSVDPQLAIKLVKFYGERGLDVKAALKQLYARTQLVHKERELYADEPAGPQRDTLMKALDQKEDVARTEFESIKIPAEWMAMYFSDTPETLSDDARDARITNGEALYATKLTEADKDEKRRAKVFSVERLTDHLMGDYKPVDDADQVLRAARDATVETAKRTLETRPATADAASGNSVVKLINMMTEYTLKQRAATEKNAKIINDRKAELAAIVSRRQEEDKKKQDREAAKRKVQDDQRKAKELSRQKEEEERRKKILNVAVDDDNSSDDETFGAAPTEEEEEQPQDEEPAEEGEAVEETPEPAAAAAVAAPAVEEVADVATKAKLELYFSRNNVMTPLMNLALDAVKEVQQSIDSQQETLPRQRAVAAAVETSLVAAKKKLTAARDIIASITSDLRKKVENDAQSASDVVTDSIREAARLSIVAKAKIAVMKSVVMIERQAELFYNTGSIADAEQWIMFRKMFFDIPVSSSMLWGEYYANIVGVKNLDEAKKQLAVLQEEVTPNEFEKAPVSGRLWLLHSALFVFFHTPARSSQLLDFVFYDTTSHAYASLIEDFAPHVTRYLAAACIFHRKRRSPLQKTGALIKNTYNYRDPITDFVDLVFNKCDYASAMKAIAAAKKVMEDDFFLSPHKAHLEECMHKFVLEYYIRCHRVVPISFIAACTGKNAVEAEPWVANLIREAEICAKIDSVNQQVLVGSASLSIAQRVLGAVESVDRPALS